MCLCVYSKIPKVTEDEVSDCLSFCQYDFFISYAIEINSHNIYIDALAQYSTTKTYINLLKSPVNKHEFKRFNEWDEINIVYIYCIWSLVLICIYFYCFTYLLLTGKI